MAKRKTSDSELLKEAGAAAIGVAIGTALGMLFSPRSGKRNRDLLVKETKKAVKKVQAAEATAKKTVRKRTTKKK